MKGPRWRLRCAAVAIAGCTVAATAPLTVAAAQSAAPRAAAARPAVRLITAQSRITTQRFGSRVFLDPGFYVASLGSALQFDVQRASYAKPVTITQVIHLPDGSTTTRPLPASILHGFNGLRNFMDLTVADSSGKVVATHRYRFCPDVFDPQKVSPGSPATSPYPNEGCLFDPFQLGMVWGIQQGWGADAVEGSGHSYRLHLGTYQVTGRITNKYRQLLGISAADATAHVQVKIVKPAPCCGERPVRDRPHGGTLPRLPHVATLRNPPQSALPDLVPLPSWGIRASHFPKTSASRAEDELMFGATVWIGGSGPLDVEGFRSNGAQTMKAYQYFWRNGHVIGRARAGTMGFSDYNQWHFKSFARYQLLSSAKTLAVRSHKEGFCIAPSDAVNLVLPDAVWQPSFLGLNGACGTPTALSVQEMLPLGWGDTYFQSVPGQAFNITHVPNGTYYIEVIVNPEKVLHESDTSNDVSLRKVILGGIRGHRTVRVPAFDGIDPEH
jgi:Lysyl oxidase